MLFSYVYGIVIDFGLLRYDYIAAIRISGFFELSGIPLEGEVLAVLRLVKSAV